MVADSRFLRGKTQLRWPASAPGNHYLNCCQRYDPAFSSFPGRAQGEVPLAGLASGSYVLRYTTATVSFTGRCVVE